MQSTPVVVHYSPAPAGAPAPSEPAGLRAAIERSGHRVAAEAPFAGEGYAGARLGVAAADGGAPDVAALRREVAAASADLAPGAGAAVVPSGLADAPRLLLVMDVDSTLIRQEVIELLAAHAGKEAEVAAVTEAAMRGDLDFAQSLHARVATLSGLPVSVVEAVRDAVELSPGARDLVAAFHAAGHAVGVVSGGFIQILAPLAEDLGLDFATANTLGVEDGRLTGTVEGDVVDRAAKEARLREWAGSLGIPLEHTIAAGDGANDLDMVRAAGLGVAYNAKPALRDEADAAIDLPRLDIIRHLAGV